MVRDDKAAITRTASTYTSHGHPSAGKGGFLRAEFLGPRTAQGTGWGQHNRAAVILGVQIRIGEDRVGQGDPLFTHDAIGVLGRRVGQDRADVGVEHR